MKMTRKIDIRNYSLLLLCAGLLLISSVSVRAAAGDLDPTFGNGGKVVIETQPRFLKTSNCGSVRYGYDVPRKALLQSDGKIVVVGVTQSPSFNYGYCEGPYPGNGSNASSFTVMRFNTDGTLDNSFNNSGMLIIQSPLPAEYSSSTPLVNDAVKVSSQPSGKILVSGYILEPKTAGRSGVFRLNTDGSFDETFGDNGLFRNWNIEVLSSGKIIDAIYSPNFPYQGPCFLERYSEDGNFETTLNTYLPNVPFARQINLTCEDFTIQPDDRIVVLGKNKTDDDFAGTLGLMRLFSDSAQPKNGK